MNTPDIRFKGFCDNWEQHKLGELGKARSGVGFPDSEQGGTKGIPFFKVSDMNTLGNENQMVIANNYVTPFQITCHRWSPIEELPAIFFAKVGAAVMLNRKRLCSFPFLMDNNTMAYSLDEGLWDSNFAKALFETIDLTSLVQPGALPSYNARDVEAMKTITPKIVEQCQIGSLFHLLEKQISLYKHKLDTINNYKKAMLVKMFPQNEHKVPEIRFKGFSRDWEQHKLGDTITLGNGMDYKHLGKGSIPVYGTGGYMLSVDKALCCTDSIGIGRKGTIDNPYILRAPFWTVDTLFFATPNTEIDLYFLYAVFQTIDWRNKNEASGVPSLSKPIINGVNIVIPESYEEMHQIGKYFNNLDILIEKQNKKISCLKNLKQAMLNKMFVKGGV